MLILEPHHAATSCCALPCSIWDMRRARGWNSWRDPQPLPHYQKSKALVQMAFSFHTPIWMFLKPYLLNFQPHIGDRLRISYLTSSNSYHSLLEPEGSGFNLSISSTLYPLVSFISHPCSLAALRGRVMHHALWKKI